MTISNKKIYNGIIPTLNNISEKEIEKMLKKYRKHCPKDKRSDEELRPYVINEIVFKKRRMLKN